MKTRMTILDMMAEVHDLGRTIVGMRVSNVYDVSSKIYLFKLGTGDKKSLLLVESGTRMHTTEFLRDKASMPSGFTAKLRKHIRAKRIEAIDQIGVDRCVRIQLGSGDLANYIFIEFYSGGNIILTDNKFVVLSILRPVMAGGRRQAVVGEPYPQAQDDASSSSEVVSVEDIVRALSEAAKSAEDERNAPKPAEQQVGKRRNRQKKRDYSVRAVLGRSLGFLGASIIEHAAREARIDAAVQVSDGIWEEPSVRDALQRFVDEVNRLVSHMAKLVREGTVRGFISIRKKREEAEKGSSGPKASLDDFKHVQGLPDPSTIETPYDAKIAEIEKEVSRTQKNKATEKHLMKLKAKISRLGKLRDDHRAARLRRLAAAKEQQTGESSTVSSGNGANGGQQESQTVPLGENEAPQQLTDDTEDEDVEFVENPADFSLGKGEELDEFAPFPLQQHKGLPRKEFASFDRAIDTFFSWIEQNRIEASRRTQESAIEKRLEKFKEDQQSRLEQLREAQEISQRRGDAIQINQKLVDEAINVVRSALATGIDWDELEQLVIDQQRKENPVAQIISELRLSENRIELTLLEDPFDESSDVLQVSVDVSQSAQGNARAYFNQKRQATFKEARAEETASGALKAAERRAQIDVKRLATKASISLARRSYWFEKFHWFISSEGYVIVGGRDMQQNEMLWRRYLQKNDVYVHAEVHGAASVIVKNPSGNPIPPLTLQQAGALTVCRSKAWKSHVITSAYWVHEDQVSKSAPSGEFLPTGSFVIRGKRNFLPPAPLVMGLGILFRVGDGSVERHVGERRVRGLTGDDDDDDEEEDDNDDDDNDAGKGSTSYDAPRDHRSAAEQTRNRDADQERSSSLSPGTSVTNSRLGSVNTTKAREVAEDAATTAAPHDDQHSSSPTATMTNARGGSEERIPSERSRALAPEEQRRDVTNAGHLQSMADAFAKLDADDADDRSTTSQTSTEHEAMSRTDSEQRRYLSKAERRRMKKGVSEEEDHHRLQKERKLREEAEKRAAQKAQEAPQGPRKKSKKGRKGKKSKDDWSSDEDSRQEQQSSSTSGSGSNSQVDESKKKSGDSVPVNSRPHYDGKGGKTPHPAVIANQKKKIEEERQKAALDSQKLAEEKAEVAQLLEEEGISEIPEHLRGKVSFVR